MKTVGLYSTNQARKLSFLLYMSTCSGWCPPTLIYTAFFVVGTLSLMITMAKSDQNNPAMDKNSTILRSITLGLITIVVLYSLCYSCHPNLAWGILILKLIVVIFTLMMAFMVSVQKNKLHRS